MFVGLDIPTNIKLCKRTRLFGRLTSLFCAILTAMQSLVKSIKTGDYEVSDYGTVQILSDEISEIVYDDVTLQFSFITDEEKPEEYIRFDIVKEKTILFTLGNIKSLIYGVSDFFRFASIEEGKSAYISFRVISLSQPKIKSLEYSFYTKHD